MFLSVNEFDADDDFGDQLRGVEAAPAFLGFGGKFKDHREGSDS